MRRPTFLLSLLVAAARAQTDDSQRDTVLSTQRKFLAKYDLRPEEVPLVKYACIAPQLASPEQSPGAECFVDTS